MTLAGFNFLPSFSLTTSPSFSGGNSLAVLYLLRLIQLGLSISSVTGMKVLRRLPMSISAGDKSTPSNGVFLYDRRALYGSSRFLQYFYQGFDRLSDWPLHCGYPGLDVT